MQSRVRCVLAVASLFIALSTLANTDVADRAREKRTASLAGKGSLAVSEALGDLGIRGMSLSAAENRPVITLQDHDGLIVGNVTIVRTSGADIDVTFESDYADRFSLRWHPSSGALYLDTAGETFRIDADFEQKTSRYSDGAKAAFDSRATEIALIAESIAELKRHGIFEEVTREVAQTARKIGSNNTCYNCEQPEDPDVDWWTGGGSTSGSGGGGYYKPACNGPTVVGFAYAEVTKSVICELATRDANLKCWNHYCTGCCRFLSCDAYCQYGDYMCVMGSIYGQSCSYR